MFRRRYTATAEDHAITARFVVPVMLENLFNVGSSLVFSQITSTISSSALAATSMANTVCNFVIALFSIVTAGTGVVVSRRIGEGKNEEAGRTAEQSMLISLLISLGITLVCILLARPMLNLLMKGSGAEMKQEAVTYFRILILSLPFYIIFAVLGGVCRATGNTRTPMIASLILNGSWLIFGYLFIVGLKMQAVGAGICYVGARICACLLIMWVVFRDHRLFSLRFRNMLHFEPEVFGHVFSVGLPMSFESIFVQLGYMLANSVSMALGNLGASAYSVLNTLNSFITLPQGICSAVAISAVGRLLGADQEKRARRTGWKIWTAGELATLALGLIGFLWRTPICQIYTEDPTILKMSVDAVWILIVLDIAGVSINAISPQLQAGGDTRYCMMITLVGVWAVRLPLSYYFVYCTDLGVVGVYLANVASLYVRAIWGIVRLCGRKWIHRNI